MSISEINEGRIERAYQAFNKWEQSFDPPLNEVQRCMLLNTLFEMQKIERDRCIDIVDKANWAADHGEIIKRMKS